MKKNKKRFVTCGHISGGGFLKQSASCFTASS